MAVTAASTTAAWLLERTLLVDEPALVILCGVLLAAVRVRTPVAILAAFLGFLVWNLFLSRLELAPGGGRAQEALVLVALLVGSLLVAGLASRHLAQRVALHSAQEHVRALQSLAESLELAADAEEVYRAGTATLAASLGCDAILLRLGNPDDLAPPVDRRAWSRILPMIVNGRRLGSVELRFSAEKPRLTAGQSALARTVVRQVAQAADRTRLASLLEAARVALDTEPLRSVLHSSACDELRSSIAQVIVSEPPAHPDESSQPRPEPPLPETPEYGA